MPQAALVGWSIHLIAKPHVARASFVGGRGRRLTTHEIWQQNIFTPAVACPRYTEESILVGSTSMAKQASLVMYDTDREAKLTARLNRVEGQVRGISKMLREQRPCPEVLQQLASIQAALRSVSHDVLRNYLEHCATDAIRSGNEAVYDEMMETIQRFAK
jgi:DNA-binding FrmR family transcriptional regulator